MLKLQHGTDGMGIRAELNRLMHRWAAWRAKKVRRSEQEAAIQLGRTHEVAALLRDWRSGQEAQVVSLGQNCTTAWYLKAVGLKQVSYPFDWVTTSPAIIRHCLADRFTAFLNRSLMVSKGPMAEHRLYNANFFAHRNPKRSAEDHAYLVRCVKRFIKAMDEGTPMVFVTNVLNEHAKRPIWSKGFTDRFPLPTDQRPQDFEAMMDDFQRWNANARFVFIEEYTEGPFAIDITARDSRMVWLRFCTMGPSSGFKYLDPLDDAMAIALYGALA